MLIFVIYFFTDIEKLFAFKRLSIEICNTIEYLCKEKKNLERKKKTRITHAQYEFPVLSSRDCLMKEPFFPTCTGDDGQRKYLICSPSPIY